MMNETFEDRIGRYLAGEASLSEKEALEREMESDPSLKERFEACRRIWALRHAPHTHAWDAEKAWNQFVNRQQTEKPDDSNYRIRRVLSWAVAAALMLALGAAVFLWLDNKAEVYSYESAVTDPLVLADGSKIFLNEEGSVKVHSFKKDRRLVELKGEAFFEVAHDPSKPFIVRAGHTQTEVVGTSFNIEESDHQTTIFVKSGKVIFRSGSTGEDSLMVTSGEAAIFSNGEMEMIVNPSPNIHAWHSRELSFSKNMPFESVIEDIGDYFDKEVVFENENVKKCRITIPLSFREPRLRSILDVVVVPVNAEYIIEGEKCIIKGGLNCQ